MDDEVPGVLPPQVPHITCREGLVGITQDREPLEDINNTEGPHQHCQGEHEVDHLDGGHLPQEIGYVGHEVSCEHELENICREIVVEEESSVVEEVRKIVSQESNKKNLPSLTIILKLLFVNVKTQSASSQEIEDQECGVQEQAGAGCVPHDDVPHQVDLVV